MAQGVLATGTAIVSLNIQSLTRAQWDSFQNEVNQMVATAAQNGLAVKVTVAVYQESNVSLN